MAMRAMSKPPAPLRSDSKALFWLSVTDRAQARPASSERAERG